jgi:hypothetical protein
MICKYCRKETTKNIFFSNYSPSLILIEEEYTSIHYLETMQCQSCEGYIKKGDDSFTESRLLIINHQRPFTLIAETLVSGIFATGSRAGLVS